MSREYYIESDGDLFKMQQDAIQYAKNTAAQSKFIKPEPLEKSPKKRLLYDKNGTGINGFLQGFLKNIKFDDLILVAIIIIMINENADEELILLLILLFVLGLG